VRAVQHRELVNAWIDTPADDADALLALAKRADEVGLPHEARLFRWYALLVRPSDAAIHEALGNREQRGKWRVEIDGKWVPFEEADALGEDFDKAWRLRSEHFEMRCSAGLRAGLDALMELEALYWHVVDLFGAELQLMQIVEPMGARLYRTQKQMPNLSNNVGAYFDTEVRALFTYSQGGKAYGLMHEGTHAVLFFLFERAARSRGSIPAWLDEGWAEYMDGRIQVRVPGKAKLRDASLQPGHLQTLAAARADKKLYGVHRILNFKTSDFGASTKQDVKYAQAWALFRYLFESPDPEIRDRFFDYLREAAAGKGQASTFRKIFSKQEEELEVAPWK
jgi:hypothetical protein